MRVDSDIVDKLIQKEDSLKMSLSEAQQEILRPVFEAQMPHDEKIHYNIAFEPMAARRHHAERVHAPHEGDGRHERRRHEPVLRSDAR